MRRRNYLIRTINHTRKIAGVLAAVAVFVGIVRCLNYIYVTEEDWGRILWHNYYEDKGKIDNLYLGSSHVYCDLDPQLLDKLNGKYNFNLSTAGQLMNSTFYVLREAAQQNNLSHVYVELYYQRNTKKKDVNTDVSTWHNTDYMRPSINRLACMISAMEWENCVEFCFPFSRYRTKLGDWDYIETNVNYKKTEDYQDYQFHTNLADDNGYDIYLTQGKFASTKTLQDKDRIYEQDNILEKCPVSDLSKQYLQMTIQYCQKRNIPITLFVSPMDDLRLISTLHYDNYVDEIREIAAAYEVPFYDFNLTKEEYLPIQSNEYHRDQHHLNSAGAEVFTSFFYQVVSGEEAENAKYFHESYADKLRESTPAIFGLYFNYSDNLDETSEAYKKMWIASNRETGMEYRIILTPTEGEPYMIQDFDENKEFTVPAEETGLCTIVARMEDTPNDVVQTMEINY